MDLFAAADDGDGAVYVGDEFGCVSERGVEAALVLGVPIGCAGIVCVVRYALRAGGALGEAGAADAGDQGALRGRHGDGQRLFDDDTYAMLQAFLSIHPDAGDVIRGTGGIRKIRWTMPGRGKRGGSRVVYYWVAEDEQIYLLTLYAKGVKDDLTTAERELWRKAVEAIDND